MLALSVSLILGAVLTGGCAAAPVVESQIVEDVSAQEAFTLIQDNQDNSDFVIIDVRTPDEFADGHVENATNIDLSSEGFHDEIDKQELSVIKRQVHGKVLRETNGDVSYKIMLTDAPSQYFNRITVPDGHCFVLGDNRNNSSDSRHFGPVPLVDVKGRVDYIYFPAESWSRFGRYRD